jgi:ABC-type multidrug transport system ATPase subunit
MSSHIVTDIEEACDSVVVLSHGRLLIHDGAAVRATHAVADASTVDPLEAVGVFTGRTGEQVALVKGTDQGREATLEEVVLGYLAMPGHGARAGSAA